MSVSNPASAEFHTQRASRSDTDKISTVLQKRDPLSILPTGHPARVLPVVLSAMARGAARDGPYYVLSASGRFHQGVWSSQRPHRVASTFPTCCSLVCFGYTQGCCKVPIQEFLTFDVEPQRLHPDVDTY
jgi:hypothetical protein